MNLLEKLSLKMKILLGVVLSSILSVMLASGIFIYFEQQRLTDTLARDVKTIALIVAGNTKGALSFEDKDSAREALKTLKAQPHIVGAALFDAEGKLFASYQRDSDQTDAKVPKGFSRSAGAIGVIFTDKDLQVTEAVRAEGEQVGTIVVKSDLEELHSVFSDIFGIAVIITLVAAVFATLLSLLIQRAITQPINRVVDALKDIAEGEGDLTRRLQVNSKDELGDLAHWFNIFVEKVHGVICRFRDTSENLAASAAQLSSTTEKTNRGVMQQQAEIEQVASAITEMSGTVQEVGRNVAMAAQDAEEADSQAIAGKKIVEDTMSAIDRLANEIEVAVEVSTRLQQETNNIGAVLEVIGGIAEQTNLLALNAAIEAARAGEQGRGFAVVADEVRTLASRTQSSTQEIQEMIDRLQAGSKEAVNMMQQGRQQASLSVEQAEKAGEALLGITNAVSVIKEMTQQIASASEEQSAVTEEINKNIVSISSVSSQTADDSHQIADGSGELANLAAELKGLISQFRL